MASPPEELFGRPEGRGEARGLPATRRCNRVPRGGWMRARFTDEQVRVRRRVAAFLARECPITALRRWMEERSDGRAALPEGIWKEIAALGWLGLAVPPHHGGDRKG